MTNANLYDLSCIAGGATRHSGIKYIAGHENLNRIGAFDRQAYKSLTLRVRDSLVDLVQPNYTSFARIGIGNYDNWAAERTGRKLLSETVKELDALDAQDHDREIGPDEETIHDYDNVPTVVEMPYLERESTVGTPYSEELESIGREPEPAIIGETSTDQNNYDFVALPSGLVPRSAYDAQTGSDREIVGSDGDKVVAIEKSAGTPNLAIKKKYSTKTLPQPSGGFSRKGLDSIVAQKA
ncbi:MAG: hypothetical protein ABIG93_01685 [archaeon]